jgi:hypothetical protein
MFSTSFEKLFGISGDHKTSDLLVKIDSITIFDIPAEISRAITAIETWASS